MKNILFFFFCCLCFSGFSQSKIGNIGYGTATPTGGTYDYKFFWETDTDFAIGMGSFSYRKINMDEIYKKLNSIIK